jgi:hypothetical protein
MELSLQVDVSDKPGMSREEFRRDYLSKSKPVIIKSFANQFPAGKWTFDYLDQVIGDHIIGVIDNSVKKNTALTHPDLKMKFREFSAIIRRDEETPYRIFGFNMFREVPELRKEFPTPAIVSGILGNLGLTFFGGKNTPVRFHYDIDCSGVLMTQLIGRKRVILIPPRYNDFLYKVPFASFSLINLEKPDYDAFPGLKYVKGYDFILQPGDALLMPAKFWHFNTYLEGGMAVSFRVIARKPDDIYTGLMNTTLRLLFDKSMNSLQGDRWMERKKARAIHNAEKALRRLRVEV